MAITADILNRTLSIAVEDGMMADGSTPKLKSYNFTGVSPDATLENLYKAGDALGGLMKPTVDGVRLTEKSDLGALGQEVDG